MAEFNPGDKVIANGIAGTIQFYDESLDRVVYVTEPIGGGTDTVHAHISQTRLEKLADGKHAAEDEAPEPKTKGK